MNKDDLKWNLEAMLAQHKDIERFRTEGKFFAHHLMAVRSEVDAHSANVIGAMTKEQQGVVEAALSVSYMMGALRVCEPFVTEKKE